MRIPVDYLANLLAAGDSEVIRDVLRRLAAMRGHMRKREVLGEHDTAMAAAVGMSVNDVEDMYRLLAIANYEDRYVIPQAHAELADRLMEQQGTCGLDFEGGPGNCGAIGPDTGAENEAFMLTDENAGQARHRADARRPRPPGRGGRRADGPRGPASGDRGEDLQAVLAAAAVPRRRSCAPRRGRSSTRSESCRAHRPPRHSSASVTGGRRPTRSRWLSTTCRRSI